MSGEIVPKRTGVNERKEEKRLNNSAFIIERERFYLNDPCKYLIRGILPEKYTVAASLDGQELEVALSYPIGKTALERFKDNEQLCGKRVEALLTLP